MAGLPRAKHRLERDCSAISSRTLVFVFPLFYSFTTSFFADTPCLYLAWAQGQCAVDTFVYWSRIQKSSESKFHSKQSDETTKNSKK